MGEIQQMWSAQKVSALPTKTGIVKSECLEKTSVRGSEHPPARNNENSHLFAQSKVDAALSFKTPVVRIYQGRTVMNRWDPS